MLAGQGHPVPRIDFVPGVGRCPDCGEPLGVYKSRIRTVATLAHGRFEAREILARCIRGAPCPVVGSEELGRLVPSRRRYGYDLVVHAGLSRYVGGMQREEIRAELRGNHGIDLSVGTVSNLCDRFLAGLERLHQHRAPALRAAMEGGYPLHLDATCEKGRGGLFVALDGWRGWVLTAGRIPTERRDHVQPLVEKAVAFFGDPVAIVRDMGDAIGAAVEPLRGRGVPDLVCHYHFLAAVGKKLLEHSYTLLRAALRRTGLRGDLFALLRELRLYRRYDGRLGAFGPGEVREDLLALVLWLLEGDGRKDEVFPFGLPHLRFVRRCERADGQAELWVPSPRTRPERGALRRLRSLLARLPKEPGVAEAAGRLDEAGQAFRELREVLRLTGGDLPRGDLRDRQPGLPAREVRRLVRIERELVRYKEELDRRTAAGEESPPHAAVRRCLERHGARLFGHPVRRDGEGRVIAVVARTNNVLEHLFGSHKQALRRRLGRAHLARDLQQQPAQAALVSNLHHPGYVEVLCGSLDNLPAAFAALEGAIVEGTTPLIRDHRDHGLHRRIGRLLGGTAATSERDTPGPRETPGSEEGPDLAPAPSETEGLTEEQMRARCATVFAPAHDPRLPPPGGVLTRTWQGAEHHVRILERDFEYRGRIYTDLTAIAREVTRGSYESGAKFFRLDSPRDPDGPQGAPPAAAPTYPLGPLAKRIREELTGAGYGATTIRSYVRQVQRYADHHMRSPEQMGAAEVGRYLLHLMESRPKSLASHRATRTALRTLYKVLLGRPGEIEDIPLRPEALTEYVTNLEATASVAPGTPPVSVEVASPPAATVV